MIYAHRGANWHVPENTIEAFQEGLNQGADALEMDVRLTKDDVVIVFHDVDGTRMVRNRKPIHRLLWSDIQKWDLGAAVRRDPMTHHFLTHTYRVPTFEQVLQAFPGTPLNVDIKTTDLKLTSMVIDLIRKYDAVERVRLTSFHWRVHRMIRQLGYEGPTGLSRYAVIAIYFFPLFLLENFDWSNKAVQIPPRWGLFRLDSKKFIEKCHKLGLIVDYWVINDVQAARQLRKNGADGMMSDDPAQILSAY